MTQKFLKDFEPFTFVIDANGHTSPLSLQRHATQIRALALLNILI